MKFSASQIQTIDGEFGPEKGSNGCTLAWWFDRTMMAPRVSNDSHIFGTILHEVIERYLKHEDRSLLYPDNWWVAYNKYDPTKIDGEVNTAQRAIIMKLIEAGIEEGVIVRRPGGLIEHEFNLPTGIEGPDGEEVLVNGFIDYASFNRIEDHKTSKSRRYLKSKNKLPKNTQVLLYAYALKHISGYFDLNQDVTIRHNQFVKDPENLLVKYTEVTVPWELVDDRWAHCIEVMKDAVQAMKRAGNKNKRKQLLAFAEKIESQEIEGTALQEEAALETAAASAEEARQEARAILNNGPQVVPQTQDTRVCTAYGGCDYSTICLGQDTPSKLEKKKIEFYTPTVNKTTTNERDTKMSEEKQMTAAEKLRARKQQAGGGISKAPANAEEKAVLATEAVKSAPTKRVLKKKPAKKVKAEKKVVAEVPQEVLDNGEVYGAPWAQEDCKACEGFGFNSKGDVCPICDNEAEEGVKSKHYNIEETNLPGILKVTALGTGAEDKDEVTYVQLNLGEVEAATPTEASVEAELETVANAEAEAIQELDKHGDDNGEAVEVVDQGEVTVEDAGSIGEEVTEEPAKKKRKRRTKAEIAADKKAEEEKKQTPETEVVQQEKKGFPLESPCLVLVLNAIPQPAVTTNAGVVDLHQTLDAYKKVVVQQQGAKNWSFIPVNRPDVWKRREHIEVDGELILQVVKDPRNEDAEVVYAYASGLGNAPSDLKSLVDALRPYADVVIEGGV